MFTGTSWTTRFAGSTRPSRTQRSWGEDCFFKTSCVFSISVDWTIVKVNHSPTVLFSGVVFQGRPGPPGLPGPKVCSNIDVLIEQLILQWRVCSTWILFVIVSNWELVVFLLCPTGKHGTELPRTQRREGIYCVNGVRVWSSPSTFNTKF